MLDAAGLAVEVSRSYLHMAISRQQLHNCCKEHAAVGIRQLSDSKTHGRG